MPTGLGKRLFTVDEYYKMAASNIFAGEQVELVEGEVVTMAPMGSAHAACVTRLTRLLARRDDDSFLIRVQLPLRLGEMSELEPDVAIVRARPDFYSARHPSADDVLLVVEVAESSLAYDRGMKIPLYARSGVPEVWLVDMRDIAVTVHRSPTAAGYEQIEQKGAADAVGPTTLPQVQLQVHDFVGE